MSSQGTPYQPDDEDSDRNDRQDPATAGSTVGVVGVLGDSLTGLHLGHGGQGLEPETLRLRLRRRHRLRLELLNAGRLRGAIVHGGTVGIAAPVHAIGGEDASRPPVRGHGLLCRRLLHRRVPGGLGGVCGRRSDPLELCTLLGRPGMTGGQGLPSTLRAATDEPQHPVPVEHPVIHGRDLSST